MATLRDIRSNLLTEQEILQEASLGKLGSTYLVSKLIRQSGKLKKSDGEGIKELGELVKTLGLMVYAVQLSFKDQKK